MSTSFCWIHVGNKTSVESTHTPEFNREQAEEYGREALGDDWLCSMPRTKNTEPDTLETQLQGAIFYREKIKGEVK